MISPITHLTHRRYIDQSTVKEIERSASQLKTSSIWVVSSIIRSDTIRYDAIRYDTIDVSFLTVLDKGNQVIRTAIKKAEKDL
jgi:hypothetical protein